MGSRPSIAGYLAYMFNSAVSGWWALVTGIIGVVSWVFVPADSITMSKLWLLALVIVVSFSFYIGFSVVLKGWQFYSRGYDKITAKEIVSNGSERIFLLNQSSNVRVGTVLEVYRVRESVEIPIGLIEAIHEKEDGCYQAHPLWIMPVHLRDLETGNLSAQSLLFRATLSKQTLARWINDEAEQQVQALLKRGRP